jgi:hypothetical protein
MTFGQKYVLDVCMWIRDVSLMAMLMDMSVMAKEAWSIKESPERAAVQKMLMGRRDMHGRVRWKPRSGA